MHFLFRLERLLFNCFCIVNCKQLGRCKRSISSPHFAEVFHKTFNIWINFKDFFQHFQTRLSDMLSLSSLFIVGKLHYSGSTWYFFEVGWRFSFHSLPVFKSRRFSSSLLTSFKAMRVVIRCLVSNWRCSINESTLFSLKVTVSSALSWIWCWLCWASKT